jgi:hypothetical protein
MSGAGKAIWTKDRCCWSVSLALVGLLDHTDIKEQEWPKALRYLRDSLDVGIAWMVKELREETKH